MDLRRIFLIFCFILNCSAQANIGQESTDTTYLYKYQLALPNSHSQINDLVIDSCGYVYIIYTNSILKYDGKSFKSLTKATLAHDNFIRGKIYNDKVYIHDYLGRLFYCQNDSLFPYKYNDLLVEYNPYHELCDFKLDSNENLHISYINSGYILIDSNGQLRFPLVEKGFLASAFVCILDEREDPFFVSTLSPTKVPRDTFILMNSNFEIIDKELAYRRCHKLPLSGARFRDTYYFSTGRGQLIHFDKKGVNKVEDLNIKLARIYANKKYVWASVFGSGLLKFSDRIDLNTASVEVFSSKSLLASTHDFENNCWAYEPEGKVYQLSPNSPVYSPELNKLFKKNSILAIDLSESTLIVIANDSLYQLKVQNETIESIKPIEMPPSNDPHPNVINRGDTIYLGLRGELYSKSLGDEEWSKIELPKEIFRFHYHNNLNLFEHNTNESQRLFGTHNRFLIEIESQNKISVFKPFTKNIIDVQLFKNQIVVQTENDLLIQTDSSFISLLDYFPVLIGKQINLASLPNMLFISSLNEGLFKFNSDTLEEIRIKGKSITNGKLIKSSTNEIICLSDQGLIRLNLDTVKHSLSISSHPNIPYFNSTIYSNNNHILIWLSYEGELLFKSFEKLYVESKSIPKVKIEVRVDGKDNVVTGEQIKPTHDFIQVIFNSLVLSQNISYRFRIEGFLDEWQETNQSTLQFARLNGGNYEIEVQQRKDKLEWSKSSFYYFEVDYPFYQSWWFILFSSIALFVIVSSIIGWQVKFQSLQKEHELDQMRAEQLLLRSQMSPHFISNILASLHYLILKNLNREADQFISSFSGLMKKSYRYSRLEHVNLKEEIDFINEYLNLQKLRLKEELQFSIEVRELNPNQVSIPTFLIQPLVENAVHHGLKGKESDRKLLIIISSLESNWIQIQIKDNGIGFSKSLKEIKKESKIKSSLFVIMERLEIINQRPNNNLEINRLAERNEQFTQIIINIRIYQ